MDKFLSKGWFPYCLIWLVTLLIWGQSVRFDFVWDDQLFISRNKSIRSLKNIPEMFHSLEAQASETTPLFRPLRTAHFAILHAIGAKPESQPWIFHLANVLWHTVAVMLLFGVALLLFERQSGEVSARARILALLVSIGFGIHPVTAEVVCWAKCLDDIMATVFVLAATRSLLKWDEGKGGYFSALIYFLLAVYSKESAVPFALLVFFMIYRFHQLRLRRSIALTAPFLLVAFVYMAHRHLVIGRSSQAPPISGSYGQTLIDMFPVVTKYVRLLLGVPPFCIDYGYMQGHNKLFSWEVLAGMALLLLFIAITIKVWRQQQLWLAGFGFLWSGLFLLPVSNLLPMMQYMAERFLYLPLIGFLLTLGALLQHVSRSDPASTPAFMARPCLANAAALFLVSVWALLSWNRSWIWQDELTLFVRSGLQNSRSKRVEKNAIVAVFCLPHMRALFPDYLETASLRMTGALPREKAEPVIKTLTEAHRIFSDNDLVSTSLAFAYAKSGRPREALPLFELAARQNPNEPQSWVNLANASMDNTNAAKARQACEMALRLDPKNVDALRLELEICSDSGDYQTALASAKKLQEIDPQNLRYQDQIHDLEKRLEAANTSARPK